MLGKRESLSWAVEDTPAFFYSPDTQQEECCPIEVLRADCRELVIKANIPESSRQVVLRQFEGSPDEQAVLDGLIQTLLGSFAQKLAVLTGSELDRFARPKRLLIVGGKGTCDSEEVKKCDDLKKMDYTKCLMVYDYVEHDLLGLILRRIKFTTAQQKCIIKRMLEAVLALHEQGLEHGYLKSKAARFT